MGMFRDNPVLSRELLVNLRSHRAFVLQLVYALVLAAAVLVAWPRTGDDSIGIGVTAARQLFDLFFFWPVSAGGTGGPDIRSRQHYRRKGA